MGKLHEVLAVEGRLGETARRLSDEAVATFTKRKELFDGVRTEDEPGELDAHGGVPDMVAATEVRHVQETVAGKLAWVHEALAPYWNALAEKDRANQEARANVEVDGVTVLSDAPATLLLTLEKQLASLRAVVAAAPTRDGSIPWTNTEWPGVAASPRERRVITKKRQRVEKVHPPTEHQPGSHVVFSEDVAIGTRWITKLDGRTTSADKADVLGRIDRLMRAVRASRSRANEVETRPSRDGAALLEWIFGTSSGSGSTSD